MIASTTASPSRDVRARQPRSSQGADIIKQRIKQGIYKPGEALPSLRTLSNELSLSYTAVQRAVQQLEREAIIESKHGVGNRVLESADCRRTPLIFGFVQPYFSHFSLTLQKYLEEALDDRSNLCFMKSTHNNPERERQEIERLIESGINGLLLWPVDGDTNGPFLEEICKKLPVVFIDRTLQEVQAPSVVIDYENGARQIVRHLHQQGHDRILCVCDPANISSFNQLRAGLREEAATLGIANTLTILDYPVIPLIEAADKADFSLADARYHSLAPALQSGQYDAFFCPQNSLFAHAFATESNAGALSNIHAVTLQPLNMPVLSRHYHELQMEEWILDNSAMIVQALEILQDMTLGRRPRKRNIRVPILRKPD